MVRELADWRVDRYQQVMQWPLAEALAAWEARLKRYAQDAWNVEYLAWNIRAAAGSRQKPPRPPAILREQ